MCKHAWSCPTLQPLKLWPFRLLCAQSYPGKSTGLGCHFLFQGIFPTQGSNLHLLLWQADSLPLSQLGSPQCYTEWLTKVKPFLDQPSAVPKSGWELRLWDQTVWAPLLPLVKFSSMTLGSEFTSLGLRASSVHGGV